MRLTPAERPRPHAPGNDLHRVRVDADATGQACRYGESQRSRLRGKAAEPPRPTYGRASARSARPPRPEQSKGLVPGHWLGAGARYLLRKRGSRGAAMGLARCVGRVPRRRVASRAAAPPLPMRTGSCDSIRINETRVGPKDVEGGAARAGDCSALSCSRCASSTRIEKHPPTARGRGVRAVCNWGLPVCALSSLGGPACALESYSARGHQGGRSRRTRRSGPERPAGG